MRQMVNGRVVELLANTDGSVNSDDLRRLGGVPNDRPLIMQLPDGSNQIINPGENVNLPQDRHFTDAPLHIRGVVVF